MGSLVDGEAFVSPKVIYVVQCFPSVWLLKSYPAKNHSKEETSSLHAIRSGKWPGTEPPRRSINICNSNYTYSGYASTAQGAQQVLNFSRSQTKNPATWWCSLSPLLPHIKNPEVFTQCGQILFGILYPVILYSQFSFPWNKASKYLHFIKKLKFRRFFNHCLLSKRVFIDFCSFIPKPTF